MKTANAVIFFYGGKYAPAAPTLSAPANAAALDDTTPEFSWQAVPGAVTYDIEIRATLTGTPTATGIAGTTYTPSALDAALTYNWRVRAVNAVGAGAWSATRTFSFDYATYITNVVTPVLWRRYRETGGGSPVNSGSATLTITQSNVTQGQVGKLGTNEAADFNGTTSYEQITNHAALANLTTQRWIILCKPDTLGEGNAGRLFCWGKLGTTDHSFNLTSSNRLAGGIGTTGTRAAATSNLNQISDCIGVWCAFAMDYDDANALGSGRKIRLFKIVGNAVTQLTLATDTALVGTCGTPATDLYLGNRSGNDFTFDGLFDEVIGGAGLWTTELLTRIGQHWGLL